MSTAKLEPRGGEGDKIEVSTREELVDRVRERLGFRRRGCRRERGREGVTLYPETVNNHQRKSLPPE